MQENEQAPLLKEISGKLDKIIRLLAVNTVKEYGTEQEKIELLDSMGFRPIDIANFVNKSQDNVNVQLNIIRKKKQKAVVKSETDKATIQPVTETGGENEPK